MVEGVEGLCKLGRGKSDVTGKGMVSSMWVSGAWFGDLPEK
jgi:hypothetical protein